MWETLLRKALNPENESNCRNLNLEMLGAGLCRDEGGLAEYRERGKPNLDRFRGLGNIISEVRVIEESWLENQWASYVTGTSVAVSRFLCTVSCGFCHCSSSSSWQVW